MSGEESGIVPRRRKGVGWIKNEKSEGKVK
jgi:hypothetical protein